MAQKIKKTIETKHVLFLGDVGRPPIRAILRGLLKYVRLWGFDWVLYINSPDYHTPNLEELNLENFKRWNVGGIVDLLDNPSKTEEILKMDLPCVNFSRSQKQPLGKYCIIPPNAEIAETAAKYFLDKKFVNFGYCGVDALAWSQEREEAFEKYLTQKGFDVHIYKQPSGEQRLSWEKELPSLVEWLKSLPYPIGLMVGSDDRGRQILEACQVAGLHVPEQVAVLSNGDEDIFCEITRPQLSSISFHLEDIGYRIGELLSRLMKGGKVPPQSIVSALRGVVERQSSDVLAIDDDVVKEAARFIRVNIMKPLGVADVADSVAMSTRALDRRFKKSLGHSVYKEIAQQRTDQVCEMLLKTSLSITQIALDMGYSDPKNLIRAFKREKGTTPQTYRETHTAI